MLHFADGAALEGGSDHGVRHEAGRGEHVAANAERMLPSQIFRLRTGRRHDRLRQKAGSLS